MRNTLLVVALVGSLASFSGAASARDQTSAVLHDLRHELGAGFSAVTLSLGDDGTATVAGNVESGIERQRIETWLRGDTRVRDVINLVNTD